MNKINNYAIIPSNIRYDEKLNSSEKLLYGEISALTNKYGYCNAQNKYFAELYKVTITSVSRWISHLQELDYIKIEFIKNDKILTRHIYINDNPLQNCKYLNKNISKYADSSNYLPIVKKNNTYKSKQHLPKCKGGISKNVKDNNIIEDEIFNLIINNNPKVPEKFLAIITNLEFNYTQNILKIMSKDKVEMVKNIVNVLYSLYKSKFRNILFKADRTELIKLYIVSEEHNPNNLPKYYRHTIINKYSK